MLKTPSSDFCARLGKVMHTGSRAVASAFIIQVDKLLSCGCDAAGFTAE